MAIAWGFLFPSGAFISLGWRSRLANGKWLAMHSATQVFGLVLTLAGLAVAVTMVETGVHFTEPHHIVGLVLIILACLQPLNALARGKPAAATGGVRTTRRAVWEITHKSVGYSMIGASVYQAFSGSKDMADDPHGGRWLLILFLALLGLSLGFLVAGITTRRKPAAENSMDRGVHGKSETGSSTQSAA